MGYKTPSNEQGSAGSQVPVASTLGDAFSDPVAASTENAEPVIENVPHAEPAASISPEEAELVVSTQWADHVEMNLGAAPSQSDVGASIRFELSSRDRILLLELWRHPQEYVTALRENVELQACRENLHSVGLHFQLPSQAFIFVEPFQYRVAENAAMTHMNGSLRANHIISSQRFEPAVMRVLSSLRSRLNARLRRTTTVLQPHEPQVFRTFLHVPERLLRNAASVTQSSSEVHGASNPRR